MKLNLMTQLLRTGGVSSIDRRVRWRRRAAARSEQSHLSVRETLLCGLILATGLAVNGCDANEDAGTSAPPLAPLEFTAVPAPEWTALFQRSEGWLSADGIYSIPRSGVDHNGASPTTLFYFGDTVIGRVNDKDEIENLRFLNNTTAILSGSSPDPAQIRFFWPVDASGQASAVFVPNTAGSQAGDWYWMGDGFVNQALGDTTYLFASRIRKTDGPENGWNFKGVGLSLISIPPGDEPPFANARQMETPFYLPAEAGRPEITFGSAVLVNTKEAGAPHPDGFVYIYGVGGAGKGLLAARVRPESFLDFDAWTFWNGSAWVTRSADLAVMMSDMSNELSVTPTPDGRYIVTYQFATLSPDVAMRVGESPVGPWGPVKKVYHCPEADNTVNGVNNYCYNAKAHPHLSAPGELLVSYNVNANGGGLELLKVAHRYYRPRFLRVSYK